MALTLADLNLEAGEETVLAFVLELTNDISFSTTSPQTILERRDGQTPLGTILHGDLELHADLFEDDDPVTNVNRLRLVTAFNVIGRTTRFHDDSAAIFSHVNDNHAESLRCVWVTEDVSSGNQRRVERTWVAAHSTSGNGFVNLGVSIVRPGLLWGTDDEDVPLGVGDQVLIGWIRDAPDDAGDQELEASLEADHTSTFAAALTYEAATVLADQELEAELDTTNTSTFAAQLTYEVLDDQDLEAEITHSGVSTFAAALTYATLADQSLEAELDTTNTSTFAAQLTYEVLDDQDLEAEITHGGVSTFGAELTYHEAPVNLELSDLNLEVNETAVLQFVFELDSDMVFTEDEQVIYNRTDGETEAGTVIAGSVTIDSSILSDGAPVTNLNRFRVRTRDGLFGRRLGHNHDSTTDWREINNSHADELRVVYVTRDISAGTTRRYESSWVDAFNSAGANWLNLHTDLATPSELWGGSVATEPLESGDQVLIGWIREADASDFEIEAEISHDGVSTFDAELTYHAEQVSLTTADLNLEEGQTAIMQFVLRLPIEIDFHSTTTNQTILDRRDGVTPVGTVLSGSLVVDGTVFPDDDAGTNISRVRIQRYGSVTGRAISFNDDSTATLSHINSEHGRTLRVLIVTKDLSAGTTRRFNMPWEDAHISSGNGFVRFDLGSASIWSDDEANPLQQGDEALFGWVRLADFDLEALLDTAHATTFAAALSYQTSNELELEAELDHAGESTFSAELTYSSVETQGLQASITHSGVSTFAAALSYTLLGDQYLETNVDHTGISTFSANLSYNRAADIRLEADISHAGQSTFTADITYLAEVLYTHITSDTTYTVTSTFQSVVSYKITRAIRDLANNLFRMSPTETIELRVYEGVSEARQFGAAQATLPSYTENTLDVIVVPVTDSEPTENVSGRAGFSEQLQQDGGKRSQSSMNFLFNAADVQFTRRTLSQKLVKIVYAEEVWNVDAIKIFPAVYQLTASTEFANAS